MAVVGGDLEEIVCSHPVLGTIRFQPKSNESFTIDTGGFRVNDDGNQITGDGTMIQQINRMRWSVEGPIAIDTTEGTTESDLTALAESPQLGEWSFTHISGTIRKGTGTVVADIQSDFNVATLTLKVSGGGRLEVIS
jgi:hypothetical protein